MPVESDPETQSNSGGPSATLEQLLERLQGELTLKELWKIASRVGISAERFEKITGLSPHRLRRGRGGEEIVEAEKNAPILRCARVFKRVVALCNKDEAAARNWLNADAPMLKGRKPIEVAETAPGAKSVDALVAQLEKAAGLA
ncbi:MAG TPA: antitoxin Xre/MbcA/ParS toxin-binding domain-containing protein [Opitutaceae bacterium]|nr:antitoxin Xre/MbcA/ParS toxin-binding domain-containing protein [Opitutaceae bacterium]